jgi:hypothetical protein
LKTPFSYTAITLIMGFLPNFTTGLYVIFQPLAVRLDCVAFFCIISVYGIRNGIPAPS